MPQLLQPEIGDMVLVDDMILQRGYTDEAHASRRPGVFGMIVEEDDGGGHGRCFAVVHNRDKTMAYYDPCELTVVGR